MLRSKMGLAETLEQLPELHGAEVVEAAQQVLIRRVDENPAGRAGALIGHEKEPPRGHPSPSGSGGCPHRTRNGSAPGPTALRDAIPGRPATRSLRVPGLRGDG